MICVRSELGCGVRGAFLVHCDGRRSLGRGEGRGGWGGRGSGMEGVFWEWIWGGDVWVGNGEQDGDGCEGRGCGGWEVGRCGGGILV